VFFSTLSVNRHIKLKSEYLAKSIFRELVFSYFYDTDLLVGNSCSVVFVYKLLQIFLDVFNIVILDIFFVGIDFSNYLIVLNAANALTLVYDNIQNTGNST